MAGGTSRFVSWTVDRFVELNAARTSRKTAVLMVLALPLQVGIALGAHFLYAGSRVVHGRAVDQRLAAGVAVVIVCLAAAAVSDRRGQEGRWTAGLTLVLYPVWVAWLVLGLGPWSTAILAWAPILTVLACIWWDERIGVYSFGVLLALVAADATLVLTHAVPYAQLLRSEDLSRQVNVRWALTILLPFVGFSLYGFILTSLTTLVRQRQATRLRVAHQLLGRYAPAQLVDHITAAGDAASMAPERRLLTVFFSDIEGFTDAADVLDAEDLASVLNEYLSEMAVIADRHGGTVEQFVGDAVMVFFGAPVPLPDEVAARRCVQMALDMQTRLADLHTEWVRRGIRTPFRARMGINTGHASVGDYGSEARKTYSAVGIQVNIAARIQSHCQPGHVLISETTWARVNQHFTCVPVGPLNLKGVHYPVHVYEVSSTTT